MKFTNYNLILVCGGMGTGKSTYSAYLAYHYGKQGRKIYSNKPIHGCIFDENLTDNMIQYDVSDSILLVDEAGPIFNARNSTGKNRQLTDTHYRYLSTLRHRNTTVFMFVQSWQRLDTILREHAQEVVLLTKSYFGFTKHRHYISALDLVACNDYSRKDTQIKAEFMEHYNLIQKGYFYRKKYYWMFDSYEDLYFSKLPQLNGNVIINNKPVSFLRRAFAVCFSTARRTLNLYRRSQKK